LVCEEEALEKTLLKSSSGFKKQDETKLEHVVLVLGSCEGENPEIVILILI
jgi:hypothetical protein